MKLSDLLNCVKPLVFEDGLEGFEYSRGGTFFFAQHAQKCYGITAKHCLMNRNPETIRLLIPGGAPGNDFVPLRTLHTVDDPVGGPEEWSDLVFMELRDEELGAEQRRAHLMVNLAALGRRPAAFQAGDVLVTRGYPFCIGGIDYDRRKIEQRSFSADGFYEGKDAGGVTHVFRLSDMSNIEDPNGMSGSPVFKLEEIDHGYDYWSIMATTTGLQA